VEDFPEVEARKLILREWLRQNRFPSKRYSRRRDLIIYRYSYLTIVFLLSWLALEAEYFLMRQWVSFIYPLVVKDIMLFLFLVGIASLVIIAITAKVLTVVVNAINESFDNLLGTTDKWVTSKLSTLPAYVRIPLFVYYFFTFDIDAVYSVWKKWV